MLDDIGRGHLVVRLVLVIQFATMAAKYMTGGYVWLIIAIGLWYSGLGNPLHDFALMKRAQVTSGSLLDESDDAGDTDEGGMVWSYGATYSYRIPDGRRFTNKYESSSSHGPITGLPENLQVEYLPDNPRISRVKGTGSATVREWIIRTTLSLGLLALFVAPGLHLLKVGINELRGKPISP